MPFLDTVMCTVHLGSGINPSDWLQVTISTYLPHGSVVVNLMLINIHYIHPSHFSSFPLLHLVPSISIISPCGLLIRGCHWGSGQLLNLRSIDNYRDFVTCAHIVDHFWWPHLSANITWFIRNCHICQLHQTHNILIPPVVTIPTPLFMKMYMDTMHLLKSGGFKYFIQSCCSLTHFPKYCLLHAETTKTISIWIFEDILCQWGTLCKIITDNGLVFIKALAYLLKCYHIQHICIFGYNSCANGIVEQVHFNVQQALFKAWNGNQSKWHSVATSIMWADHVTVHQCMGCSPYFSITGDEPGSFIQPYTPLFLLFHYFLYIADPPLGTPPLQPHM